jgi:hypothetical protein
MELLYTLNLTAIGAVLMFFYLQRLVVINQHEISLKESNKHLFILVGISSIIACSSFIPIFIKMLNVNDPFLLSQVIFKIAMIPLLALHYSKIKEFNKKNIVSLVLFMYLLNDMSFPFYFIYEFFNIIDLIGDNSITEILMNISKIVYEAFKQN